MEINYEQIDLAKLQRDIDDIRNQRKSAMIDYEINIKHNKFIEASICYETAMSYDENISCLNNLHRIAMSRRYKS